MKNRAIKFSVGRNGRNRSIDVKTVQRLLNRAIEKRPKLAKAIPEKLEVSGKCDAQAIEAIEQFQTIVCRWSGPAVDGQVKPDGATWKKLNGNRKSTAKIKPMVTTSPMWVGSYAAFKQGDWKAKLGHSTSETTLPKYGCALCTLTMAATCIGTPTEHWPPDLQPKHLNPFLSNDIIRKAGGFAQGSFTLKMQKAAEALGMTFEEYGRTIPLIPQDVQRISDHLKQGHPVAAHVDYKNNPTHDTKSEGDHWILIVSGFGDQTFTAIDPATGNTVKLTRGDAATPKNVRYSTTQPERTGVLFGWLGSGGNVKQEQYVVVRFALLRPGGCWL